MDVDDQVRRVLLLGQSLHPTTQRKQNVPWTSSRVVNVFSGLQAAVDRKVGVCSCCCVSSSLFCAAQACPAVLEHACSYMRALRPVQQQLRLASLS